MEISPYLLARMLAFSFLLGIALGAIYDVQRIFRVLTGREGSACDLKREVRIPRPLLPLFGGRETLSATRGIKRPRVRRVTRAVLLFFEDVLFFTLAGCSIALLIYYTNDGEPRLMAIASVLVGFASYQRTVGRLVILAADRIAVLLSYAVAYGGMLALAPALCLYRGAERLVKTVRRAALNKRIKKYDALCRGELSELAARGFLPSLFSEDGGKDTENKGKEKRRSKCLTEITNKRKR